MATCDVCHCTGVIMMCSNCNDGFYCSIECQRKDWNQHKQRCLSIHRQRAQQTQYSHSQFQQKTFQQVEQKDQTNFQQTDSEFYQKPQSAVSQSPPDSLHSPKGKNSLFSNFGKSVAGKMKEVSKTFREGYSGKRNEQIETTNYTSETTKQQTQTNKKGTTKKNGKTKVFGTTFMEALEHGANADHSDIPDVVYKCTEYIKAKGYRFEGIFRLSGSTENIKKLKARFDDGESVVFPDNVNPHDVACLLKLWLREMKDGIFEQSGDEIAGNYPQKANLSGTESRVYELLCTLPAAKLKVIAYLLEMLSIVADNSAENLMTVNNLSIVFSPNLNIPAEYFGVLMNNWRMLFDGLPKPSLSNACC